MYKSREHFDYGDLHFAFDSTDGSFLELYSKANYRNLIKNVMHKVRKPFVITVKKGELVQTFYPVESTRAIKEPKKKISIISQKHEDGIFIKVFYPYLTDGKEDVKSDVFWTAYVKEHFIEFSISVKNTFGGEVSRVEFPVITGVFVGESYEEDSLMIPRNSGYIHKNPVKRLAEPLTFVDTRWQEYRSSHIMSGFFGSLTLAEKGLKGYSGTYPSSTMSMSWMDLFDEEGNGMYFGCHDPKYKPCIFEVGSAGETFPGLTFSTAFMPFIKESETFLSPPVIVYLHSGDWHAGADFYRAFREPFIEKAEKISPEWMKNGAGLFAHYDFQWQDGGIVHTYKDIPILAEEAKAAGINHMLLAGWHCGGFDKGYPLYWTNNDLGTEKEFVEGVAAAKKIGVHISLYMNVCIQNVKLQTDEIQKRCILDENGKQHGDAYGNADVAFGWMCPASKEWKDVVLTSAARVTEQYGVDGVYFDMLSAGVCLCFNSHHSHAFDAYKDGYIDILKIVRKRFSENRKTTLAVMGEWVSDVFGGLVSYQLSQSWFGVNSGASPEVYQYTFPEHGIVDMIYPSKNLAMRSYYVAQASQWFMANLFTTGAYFWIYDMETDNTFKRDLEGFEILKQIIFLNRKRKTDAGDYLFVDNRGFTHNGRKTVIRRFKAKDSENSVYAVFRYAEEEVMMSFCHSAKTCFAIFGNGTKRELFTENGMLSIPEGKAILIFTR